MQLEQGKIERHEAYHGGYRRLDVQCPGVGRQVQPGQFVHVKIPGRNESLLRRPFSVFKADDRGISILYKPVGRGTETLATLTCGAELDVLGPLGKGFPVPQEGALPVLIAGGYGMAALYLCAARFPAKGVAFFGGATASDILCVEDFEALGWEVRVATNDGSRGQQGLVTAPLQAWLSGLSEGARPEFFACGPNGMLKAVADLAATGSWTSWLSVDRNMGCGVGACLACVQKIFREDGNWEWLRVCREGPVFEGRRVCWEEEGPANTCGGNHHD